MARIDETGGGRKTGIFKKGPVPKKKRLANVAHGGRAKPRKLPTAGTGSQPTTKARKKPLQSVSSKGWGSSGVTDIGKFMTDNYPFGTHPKPSKPGAHKK